MYYKIIRRLRGMVSHKQYQVYATSETPKEFAKNPNYTLARLNSGDLEKMPLCRENERFPKFLKRLEEGHFCYGHKDNATGEICSYFWVSDARSVDCAVLAFDFDFCLPDGSVYIFDCRVAEEHRGKKLYTDGLREIMGLFRGRRFIMTAETNNIISQRGILKAGYGSIGRIYFVKITWLSFALRRGFKAEYFEIRRRSFARRRFVF